MIPPIFVAVHRYTIVADDLSTLELSTWTIGATERTARRFDTARGTRQLIATEVVAGGLPRVKLNGGRGGKSPNDWSITNPTVPRKLRAVTAQVPVAE